ncbi:RNA-binding protein [Candidatus Peregrinibacteria bacterium]|jgi:cold-inducible RNA-binding protein|nr:RNA-binding protein [Candidatus Peregrinibacteria bacterium]
MAKKLFVGNIAWTTTDAELETLFSEFGVVTDSIILKDRESGRSRGFGFVTFEDDAAAEAAIEALNEKDLNGRALVVNEAKPPRNDNF